MLYYLSPSDEKPTTILLGRCVTSHSKIYIYGKKLYIYIYGNKSCTYLQGPLLYSIRVQDLNVSGANVAPTSEFRAFTILLLPKAGN